MDKVVEVTKQIDCFVIMPFSSIEFTNKEGNSITLSQLQLTHIYNDLFKRAIEAYKKNGVNILVHRYEEKRGNFTKGIINNLDKADLIIADLTGLNPNVFYELGIRHTLRVGALLLTQNINSLPSDLKNYIAFEYKYPQQADEFSRYYNEFEQEIHNSLDEYFQGSRLSDNPVYDFLHIEKSLRFEKRINELKYNIQLFEFLLHEYSDGVASCIKAVAKCKQNITFPFINYPVDAILQRFINHNESMEIISFLNDLSDSLKLNDENVKLLLVSSNGEIDNQAVRCIQYGYRDHKGNFHHIADLNKMYHLDGNNINSVGDPIAMSFLYFINAWKKELEGLLQ